MVESNKVDANSFNNEEEKKSVRTNFAITSTVYYRQCL